jgi:hypothetical protein
VKMYTCTWRPDASSDPCKRCFVVFLLEALTAAVFVMTIGASSLYAQVASATLSVTITDETDAVLPDVQIVVTNIANAFERRATTGLTGSFTATFLPPGQYAVTAEHQAFSKGEVRDVVLNIGDQIFIKMKLKVRASSESVTVLAEPSRVSLTPSVGTVVNQRFIANLPLNGRSLHALLQLVPGVVLTPAMGGVGATGSSQFNVNGQRSTANYFMVDGVSANTGMSVSSGSVPGAAGAGQAAGTTALGGTNSLASLDAVQEFRIETSTFAPEFGRTPGGQISLVTRSGTNGLHGSASEYFRHDSMDANDWFANSRGLAKARERQYLFGGALGGALVRDRAFFFGSYESLRLEQPTATVVSVPTPEVRAQGSAALRPYLDALPLPNGRSTGSASAEFAASYSNPGYFDVSALRLDGRATDALTGFLRLSHAHSGTQIRSNSLSTVRAVKADNDAVTGGLTWVGGARFTADMRVNWTRDWPRQIISLDSLGGAATPSALDIFLPGRDPSQAIFYFVGGDGSFVWGTGTTDVQRQFNVVGTASWLIKSHQLKLGLDYRRMLPLLGGGGASFESLGFTASQIALGQANYYVLSAADPVQRHAIFPNLSLYAQDLWRAGRQLTITYGVRFERVPPPTEATGRTPRTLSGIDGAVLQNPRLAPVGTPLWRSRVGEFAPRLGASYQLSTRPAWETTLRSGIGVYYDLGLGNAANAFQWVYPFIATAFVPNPPFPLRDSDRTPPVLGVTPPNIMWSPDPNLRLPYTLQWNAAVEQAVGPAQAITVTYAAAAGRQLLVRQDYSQPLAEWPANRTAIFIQRNSGRSSYSALQLQYQRRLRQGLQALASYTLARSRDDASQVDIAATPASVPDASAREFGPSDFDVRHQLSAAVTYDLPTPRGASVVRTLCGGWGVDALIRYQSALPVTPMAPGVVVNGVGYIPRPDVVVGQPLYIDDSSLPGGRKFNRAAFVAPSGQQGNFPRNGLRGFAASQVDLSLRREFRVFRSLRLQARAEVFNLFNHPNFGQPAAALDNGLFGLPTQMLNRSLGGLNALYQMGGPRSGQLAIKLVF